MSPPIDKITRTNTYFTSGGASASDSSPQKKTLILVHRYAGYKLLLRLLAQRLGGHAVRGFPPARTAAEKRDTHVAGLLGCAHDEGLDSLLSE